MATCNRCNRGLKDPVSIQRGFGPVCWAKVQAEKVKVEIDLERRKEDKEKSLLAQLKKKYEGGDAA